MKIHNYLGIALLISGCASARAQVYSQNIVGYINVPVSAGNNLLVNQLGTSDNTLTTIFSSGVPEGSTFTEWDPVAQQYLPTSVYDTTSGWSINYEWDYGQGGLFNAPAAFTDTFVGTVWPGFDVGSPFVPPAVTGAGTMLLGCVIPISDATFYDVIGRDPQNGESVTTLDPASQNSTTTIFDNGVWNNGAPELAIGQSAFFDLEPSAGGDVVVPEPASCALIGAGLLFLAASRRRQNSI